MVISHGSSGQGAGSSAGQSVTGGAQEATQEASEGDAAAGPDTNNNDEKPMEISCEICRVTVNSSQQLKSHVSGWSNMCGQIFKVVDFFWHNTNVGKLFLWESYALRGSSALTALVAARKKIAKGF